MISIEDSTRLAGLLGLSADQVRSVVFLTLSTLKRLCVGALAMAFGVSRDVVSCGLLKLRTPEFDRFRKAAPAMFYELTRAFPQPLLDHRLAELLGMAVPNEVHI